MAAAGLGYALMPALSAHGPGVVTRPLIEPEIAREIALVTVRDHAKPSGLVALVREAMRMRWPGVAGEPFDATAAAESLRAAARPR